MLSSLAAAAADSDHVASTICLSHRKQPGNSADSMMCGHSAASLEPVHGTTRSDMHLVEFKENNVQSVISGEMADTRLHAVFQDQLARMRILADRLQDSVSLIEQDSSCPGYALDEAWMGVLESLEPLVIQLHAAPYEQRVHLLEELASLHTKLRALESLLDQTPSEHTEDSHLSPVDRINIASQKVHDLEQLCQTRVDSMQRMRDAYTRIQRVLPDWDIAMPECTMLAQKDLDICAEALSLITHEKESREVKIRSMFSELSSVAARIPSSEIPSHIQSLLDDLSRGYSDNLVDPTSETPVLCLDLIEQLKLALDELLGLLHSLAKKLSTIVCEIISFWDELGVEPDERVTLLHDLHKMFEYQELCESLRTLWMVKMKSRVDELLIQVKEFWSKCCVSDKSQSLFLAKINNKQELVTLSQLYATYQLIYKSIDDRNAILKKMKEFEMTASDPKRLFRPSFQLVEEERFRKTCYPTLMKIEATLRDQIIAIELASGTPFNIDGSRYLDALDYEINGRFVNEAVFVLEKSSHNRRKSYISSINRHEDHAQHSFQVTTPNRKTAGFPSQNHVNQTHTQAVSSPATPLHPAVSAEVDSVTTIPGTSQNRSSATLPLRNRLAKSPSTPTLNTSRCLSGWKPSSARVSPALGLHRISMRKPVGLVPVHNTLDPVVTNAPICESDQIDI
ncbi:hypothetical protein BASA50_001339 [Batrachochytrium salamandrivorans]|uniref:Uncharacterized protein n=1 Tax=Batrachochytrium salamandrivorans TaxID=1357716 RepID=A0ABQ8EWE1_9FUNG|nr:hypothetical protein BASA50_001339 [Batrachochytrium salamandrivorans]